MSTYHCLAHPEFTTNDPDEICPECGSFLVDENNQPAHPAQAPAPVAIPSPTAQESALLPPTKKNTLTCCPHCQEPMEPDDEFCMSCGRAPNESPEQAPAAVKAPEPEAHNVSTVSAPEPTYPASLKVVARFSDDQRERSREAVAPKNKSERASNLDKSVVKIGRTDKESNIFPHLALDGDSGVSSRHCQFLRQTDGSYVLQDTGSANGTRLNGKPLDPDEAPPVVKAGDVIEVGFWFTISVEAIN